MARGRGIPFHRYLYALPDCTDIRGSSCTRKEIPCGGEIYISESTDSSLPVRKVAVDDPSYRIVKYHHTPRL